MRTQKPTRIVVMGPPGCGKGTQAAKIAKMLGYTHICPGAILRDEKSRAEEVPAPERTSRQREIIESMVSGNLVSDDIIFDLLSEKMKCHGGFVLDGIPRNINQAHKFDVEAVILIDLCADECVKRICDRQDGRLDDNEDVARHRMDVYNQETAPLIEYYQSKGILATVDGTQNIGSVTESILAALESPNEQKSR